jgi:hypothetical protein
MYFKGVAASSGVTMRLSINMLAIRIENLREFDFSCLLHKRRQPRIHLDSGLAFLFYIAHLYDLLLGGGNWNVS